MSKRPYHIAYVKEHDQVPICHKFHCRLIDRSDLAGDSYDPTNRLNVYPPATLEMAHHYWKFVRETLYPQGEFDPNHSKHPLILAEFPWGHKFLSDSRNYVCIEFEEMKYTEFGLVIYPILRGHDILWHLMAEKFYDSLLFDPVNTLRAEDELWILRETICCGSTAEYTAPRRWSEELNYDGTLKIEGKNML
ncbi:hypothetical protein C8J56DRAFT_883391 [Mycena floridula]|nr:hypothetical protein C8J56DRAFT_883391 [Mycena floridula]